MGTQIPKKVPMGTRVPKWGPIGEQWAGQPRSDCISGWVHFKNTSDHWGDDHDDHDDHDHDDHDHENENEDDHVQDKCACTSICFGQSTPAN